MEIETSTYVGELPSQNGHWTNKLAEGKKRVKSTNRDGQVGKTCQSYQGPTLTILICLVFTNLMILWSQKMLGHGKTTRKTIATRLRGWFICFNPEFSLPEFSWFLDLWGQKKKTPELDPPKSASQLLRISSMSSPPFARARWWTSTSWPTAPGRRNIPRFLNPWWSSSESCSAVSQKIHIRMAGKPKCVLKCCPKIKIAWFLERLFPVGVWS